MRLNAKTKLMLIQMLWGAGKVMRPSLRKLDESFEAWAYRNGFLKEIYRLEALGYIESEEREDGSGALHRLTDAGRLVALGGRDPEQCWKRRWDEKWRLFLFDIPERQRSVRRRLTRSLASMGCGCMQGSVWISPFRPDGIDPLFEDELEDYSNLIMLEADSRGGEPDRRMVAAAWDFAKINSGYEHYLSVLEGLPTGGYSPEALQRWGEEENDAWLAAVRTDPLLPTCLNPKGYAGQRAWRARRKAFRQAGKMAEKAVSPRT